MIGLLEPFFLKYDCEIMKKRFEQGGLYWMY